MPSHPAKAEGSSTLVPVTTVVRPSLEGQVRTSSPVTLAIVSTGAVLVLIAIIIVVTLLVILKIKKSYYQPSTTTKVKFEKDSAATKAEFEDHLYETPSAFLPSSVQSPPPPPPVYAAVNAMYHMALKDPDGMELEKNISYASVNVERNVAYGLLGVDPLHRPMMPLPDDQ